MIDNVKVLIALHEKDGTFNKWDALCLWNYIDPDCDEANFLKRMSAVGFGSYYDVQSARLLTDDYDVTIITPNPFLKKWVTSNVGDVGYESDLASARQKFQEFYERFQKLQRLINRKAATNHNITRHNLIAIANALGERPRFLFPDEEKQPKPLDPRKEKTLQCLLAVLAKNVGYTPDNPDTI